MKSYQIYEVIYKILFLMDQNVSFKVVAGVCVLHFGIFYGDWQNTWYRVGTQLSE